VEHPTDARQRPRHPNLRIDTPSGKTVRLADVAKVSLRPSPNAIDREGDSRRLDVSATFEGDLGGVVGQLERKVKDVKFEQGYHAEILGEWQERESAQRTLLVTAVVAGAAILLLLQASFGSWRLALLSFLTLPMALVGGVIERSSAGEWSHSVAGRLLHGLRNCRSERHSVDQPLPALGT
jgi:Cu/Ag efflux pump CusA